jgi:hypothetical protein
MCDAPARLGCHRLIDGRFPDLRARKVADYELLADLSALSNSQLLDIIIISIHKFPDSRDIFEAHVRDIEQAEDIQGRAPVETQPRQTKKRAPRLPDLDKLLRRVEKYMDDDTSSLSKAINMTRTIEKIMNRLLERCTPDFPYGLRLQAFAAMMHIWSIVIGSSPSLTFRQALRDSIMWEGAFLGLWGRFTAEEKQIVASSEVLIRFVVDIAIEWKEYDAREEMFEELLQSMKVAANGALLDVFGIWDARQRAHPASAGVGRAKPPVIDLTAF